MDMAPRHIGRRDYFRSRSLWIVVGGDCGVAALFVVLGIAPRCLKSRQWAHSGQKSGANQRVAAIRLPFLRDAKREKLQWPKMMKMNTVLPM